MSDYVRVKKGSFINKKQVEAIEFAKLQELYLLRFVTGAGDYYEFEYESEAVATSVLERFGIVSLDIDYK